MSVAISVLTPVIFTGTATTGAPDEFAAPTQGARHLLDVAAPPGLQIVGAWYAPFDAIPALQGFQTIGVDLVTGQNDQIALGVTGASAPPNQRVRLRIFVLFSN